MKSGTKKALIIVGVILVCCFGIFKFFGGTYNTIVSLDEGVSSQWAVSAPYGFNSESWKYSKRLCKTRI